MRIAMFAWEARHGFVVTGAAEHVSCLARALAREGHEVHVFTRRPAEMAGDEILGGVHYHRPDFALEPNLVDEIQHFCRALVQRAGEVEAEVGAFDLFHAHDWTTCNAGVWALEGRAVPLVLTLHSVETARSGTRDLFGDAARVADHERNGCRHAAQVITIAHALQREVMACYEVPEWRCEVVLDAIDAERYSGLIDAGAVKRRYEVGPLEPLVFCPGPLEYRTGPDLLLEALPTVRAGQPALKALFGGGGPLRQDLEQRVGELGVGEMVRWADDLDEAARVDLYRAADAVCAPGRHEPLSATVLAAWAAGTPVVVTAQGGAGEYVWHDVTGVQVHATAESVAWGVTHLLADADWAAWVGANGREAARAAFTWQRAAAHTLEVYERARSAPVVA